ncbi:MAG: DsbA family protein [Sulfolobaceae archaeon]|nr:DsbA family protein [Sulfolobaceae archaeon]
MITLVFYHDVLCPFCYVMSKRLQKAIKDFKGEIDIIHKAFMLLPSIEELREIAPTEEEARHIFEEEFSILKRFYPDYDPKAVIGKGKITYVWSLPPQMACKAAEFQGGSEAHWRYFDIAQDKFFKEGENIADDNVLIEIAKEAGLDLDRFKRDFKSKKARLAVEEDEADAKAKGIRGVPAILVNDYWLIRGVQSEDFLVTLFEDLIKYGEPRRVQLKAYWEAYATQ